VSEGAEKSVIAGEKAQKGKKDHVDRDSSGLACASEGRHHSVGDEDVTIACTFSLACDVGDLPPESCIIKFPQGSSITVGREHQKAFFEAVVGSTKEYLNYISRSHFKVMPGKKSGTLDIINLSINPIVVGPDRLKKNDQVMIKPPVDIEFISGESQAQTTTFLRLSVQAPGLTETPEEVETINSAAEDDIEIHVHADAAQSSVSAGSAHEGAASINELENCT